MKAIWRQQPRDFGQKICDGRHLETSEGTPKKAKKQTFSMKTANHLINLTKRNFQISKHSIQMTNRPNISQMIKVFQPNIATSSRQLIVWSNGDQSWPIPCIDSIGTPAILRPLIEDCCPTTSSMYSYSMFRPLSSVVLIH